MKKLYSWVLAIGPRTFSTSTLEVLGGACAVKGAASIYGPAGWLTAGAFLVALGVFGGNS